MNNLGIWIMLKFRFFLFIENSMCVLLLLVEGNIKYAYIYIAYERHLKGRQTRIKEMPWFLNCMSARTLHIFTGQRGLHFKDEMEMN